MSQKLANEVNKPNSGYIARGEPPVKQARLISDSIGRDSRDAEDWLRRTAGVKAGHIRYENIQAHTSSLDRQLPAEDAGVVGAGSMTGEES